MTAVGQFDIEMIPQAQDDETPDPFDRFLLKKAYHGDLTATSQGQMISFRSTTEGSAGYVALEQIRGSLAGKTGGFVLQHDGLMAKGVSTRWNVLVVPDSGTGELAGLAGQMTIVIEEGKHLYEFEYSLE